IDIDAVEGRQISDGIQAIRDRHDSGQLGDIVVVHLGDNGYFSDRLFDELMDLLDGRQVVIVNDTVPRRWEGSNNDILAAGVGRYPNATLADWNAVSADRPDLFYEDGLRVRAAGADAYVAVIATAIAR